MRYLEREPRNLRKLRGPLSISGAGVQVRRRRSIKRIGGGDACSRRRSPGLSARLARKHSATFVSVRYSDGTVIFSWWVWTVRCALHHPVAPDRHGSRPVSLRVQTV